MLRYYRVPSYCNDVSCGEGLTSLETSLQARSKGGLEGPYVLYRASAWHHIR